MSRNRTLAALAAAGLTATLLLSGCGNEVANAEGTEAPAAPPAPAVTVAEVLRQPVTDYEELTGRFEAIERVELRPRVSGYIHSVNFREGAEVHEGDALFVIDPRPYEAALKRARAELARAQSARRHAASERERASKLLALRAISQEEFDARTSGDEQANAEVQAAQAAVDAAELDLTFTRVRAPISGVVGRAEITAGNFVSAGETRLTSLVSVDPIYVRFDGGEQVWPGLARGARGGEVPPAFIGVADEEGHPHRAEVVFFDNQVDPATGTVRVRARLENPERRFAPGMFARVKLGRGTPYEAVLVRDSAIGTDQDRRFVLVVNPQNQVEYRTVELGALHEGLRVVRRGLAAGDRVIVNGLQRARPGSVVEPEVVAMDRPRQVEGSEAMVAGLPRRDVQ